MLAASQRHDARLAGRYVIRIFASQAPCYEAPFGPAAGCAARKNAPPAAEAAKPLLRALAGEAVWPPPVWLMRQAGIAKTGECPNDG